MVEEAKDIVVQSFRRCLKSSKHAGVEPSYGPLVATHHDCGEVTAGTGCDPYEGTAGNERPVANLAITRAVRLAAAWSLKADHKINGLNLVGVENAQIPSLGSMSVIRGPNTVIRVTFKTFEAVAPIYARDV